MPIGSVEVFATGVLLAAAFARTPAVGSGADDVDDGLTVGNSPPALAPGIIELPAPVSVGSCPRGRGEIAPTVGPAPVVPEPPE